MEAPTNEELAKAVALYYDGDSTPVISAKGVGEEAQQIIDIARENGVPLCDNALLVELLVKMELGESIPQSLYTAIAHILSFAYTLDTRAENMRL